MSLDEKIKLEIDKLNISPNGDTVLLVKVGSEDFPASQKDIENVQNVLNLAAKTCYFSFIVTHHAIDVEYINKTTPGLLWVKVGNDDHLASLDDITAMEDALGFYFDDDDYWVTHHNIEVKNLDLVTTLVLRDFCADYKAGKTISDYVDKFEKFLDSVGM